MRVTTSQILHGVFSLALLLEAEAVDVQRFSISNPCPSTIPIYINGKLEGKLVSGTVMTKTFNADWNGLIYTTANGGTASGRNATKAGFFGQLGYYYVVQDPSYFNVGVSITPRIRDRDGFCTVASCDNASCENAFKSPPTAFPDLSHVSPTPPLHSCRITKPKYIVTFCPARALPAGENSVRLHPNGNPNKCLEVRGGVFKNGTPVQIYDCNGTAAQSWLIKRGGAHTTVQVADTNFCLDAGADLHKLTNMKIWQCSKGLAAQIWSYSIDNLIRHHKTDHCLDLVNGSTNNGNLVQTYNCHSSNTNQLWTTSH